MAEEQTQQDQGSITESLGAELWRLWTVEIKPHFIAEGEFLQKYGEAAGYDRAYIGRVLSDHRLMEELVWEKDDVSVSRFARVLAAHIQYKKVFFEERVRAIVEPGGLSPETPDAERHS